MLLPKRFCLFWLFTLLLVGCAGGPPLLETGPGLANTWQLSGKIAVKNEETGEGETGYLRWRQAGDHYDIEVMGTLGIGAKRLTGDRHTATLLNTNGQTLTKGSPEALMQHYFGWSIPIQAFQAWSRGKPYPNAPFQAKHTKNGMTQSLSQLGWHLSFEEWDEKGPTRVILTKAPLRLKVFVQERMP